MPKLRTIQNIILTTLLIIFFLPILLIVITQLPFVQNFLTQKIENILNAELNTYVKIEKVYYSFPYNLTIKKLYIEDYQLDTLFYIGKLKVLPFSFSIKKQKINLKNFFIKDLKIKIIYDTSGYSNLDYFVEHLPTSKNKDTTNSEFWISIDHFKIQNATIIYKKNNNDSISITGINPNDLKISNLNTEIENLNLIKDSISFELKKFNFKEKNGFKLKQLSMLFSFGNKTLKANNFIFRTPYSRINANIALNYNTPDDLSDFINKVNFDLNIIHASINTNDLNLFTPKITKLNDSINCNLYINGNINNLHLNSLNIFYHDSTTVEIYGETIGLPDIKNSYFNINIPILKTKKTELLSLLKMINPKLAEQVNPYINQYNNINITSSITGLYKNFNISNRIKVNNSEVILNLDILQDSTQIKIQGLSYFKNLDLSKIIQNNKFGIISLHDTIDITINKNTFKGNTSAKISELYFNNYLYKNIKLTGDFTDHSFNGFIKILDSNLTLTYSGLIDFGKAKIIKSKLIIDTMQLYKLHFVKDDPMASLSLALEADFTGETVDNLTGSVKLTQPLFLIKNLELFSLKNFNINSHIEKYIAGKPVKNITIETDFFKGNISGLFTFKDLSNYAIIWLKYYFPTVLNSQKPSLKDIFNKDTQTFITTQFQLTNLNGITHFFAPKIKIADNSLLTASFFAKNKFFSLELKSDSLFIKQNRLNNIKLNLSMKPENLTTTILCDSVQAGIFTLKNFNITTKAAEDSIVNTISWDNKAHKKNFGKITSFIKFIRDTNNILKLHINAPKDSITINDVVWHIQQFVIQKDSIIKIKNILLKNRSKNQVLEIYGKISKNKKDKLFLNIQNFDLKQLDPLLNSAQLEGILTGKINISNLNVSPAINSNLTIDKLKFNKVKFGTLSLTTKWIDSLKSIKINLLTYILKHNKDTLKNINITGITNLKEKIYQFNINLNKLKIIIFQPFFKNIIRVNRLANIQGNIQITGNPVYYKVNGYLDFFGSFKVIPTNITYTINKSLHIDFNNKTIHIDTTIITDSKMIGDGYIVGDIKHNNFQNFHMNMLISLDTMPIFNIKQNPTSQFFGNLFASGYIAINGAPDDININSKIITEQNTDISILLNKPTELAKEQKFITFVQDTNKIKINLQHKENQEPKITTNYNFNLNLKIRNEAKFKVIFDQTTGEILEIQGDGDLNINKSTYSDIGMFGLITLKKGNYTLVLQNVIRKKFLIQQGSTIKWNGSPTDAQMNITTIYQLKSANLYDLVLDDNYWNQKTPVNCYINMKGTITEPQITFDIDLPKADPRIISQVKHLDQANKNLQFLSLLVLGKFQPLPGLVFDPQKQNLSASNLLSNQLSGWLSQILPIDMDINYQQQQEQSAGQLDVAMSFNLLNERLTINTDIGVAGNKNHQQQQYNNFIGDVEIEAKLNKKGNIRLKVFNKTNRYNLYDRGPYTQGIGLFFRYDFDHLGKK